MRQALGYISHRAFRDACPEEGALSAEGDSASKWASIRLRFVGLLASLPRA